MGGAMELAQKAKKVIVLMNHVNKQGESKILKTCTASIDGKAKCGFNHYGDGCHGSYGRGIGAEGSHGAIYR